VQERKYYRRWFGEGARGGRDWWDGAGASASRRDADGGTRGVRSRSCGLGCCTGGAGGCSSGVWLGRLLREGQRGYVASCPTAQGFLPEPGAESGSAGSQPPSLQGEERRGGLLSPKTLVPPLPSHEAPQAPSCCIRRCSPRRLTQSSTLSSVLRRPGRRALAPRDRQR